MMHPVGRSTARWARRFAIIAAVAGAAALSGCEGAQGPRLHQQAQAALARWADALAGAGGQQGVVLVGELTGQVGDWELGVGDNNKRALYAGLVEAAVIVPAAAPADGEVRWQGGATKTVRVISAQQAVTEIRASAAQPCPDCVSLRITGARLTTGSVETSRGPATAPIWEFAVQGTTVKVTRVALADPTTVVPPPWNADDAPGGISVDSASGTVGGLDLTVAFVGAPLPGDQGCGADYSAEAVESPTAVVVIVTEHPHGLFEACTAEGARRTASVKLAAPLGERAVLEVKQGLPVPVLLTP
jgi:hypothetical protein